MPRRRLLLLLSAILVVAFLLRTWGVNFGLPYLYHPDEPIWLRISRRMFVSGDLDPRFFKKPTFPIYVNALAYVPFYLAGRLAGLFGSPADVPSFTLIVQGVGWVPMASVVLMGRMLTVLVGTAAVGMTFLLGRRAGGDPRVGLVAALLVALSPTNVYHSRLMTENAYLTLFVVGAVWAALRIYQEGNRRDYLLAGVMIGLAAASKYPGALVALVPAVAHVLRRRAAAFGDGNIYLAAGTSILVFLLTTPYALLNFELFLEDTLFEATHYATGHAGMEGDALRWYLSYVWRAYGILPLLAVAAGVRAARRRDVPMLLVGLFVLVYFAFISSFEVRNSRTLLPMVPLLLVLAASLLAEVGRRAWALPAGGRRRVATAAVAAGGLLTLLPPLLLGVAQTRDLTRVDSRETARIWIAAALPAGATIAVESYAPYVPPGRFAVTGFLSMLDHDLQWYLAQGYEYFVFSQGAYGRFYDDPDRYAEQVAAYDSFFAALTPVRIFDDGGYEVRIYRAPAVPAPD